MGRILGAALLPSVKNPLKRVLGRYTLTYDELHTVLVELAAVVNARPLTYVYDDEETNYEPLTRSHLIYCRRITTSPNSSLSTSVKDVLVTPFRAHLERWDSLLSRRFDCTLYLDVSVMFYNSRWITIGLYDCGQCCGGKAPYKQETLPKIFMRILRDKLTSHFGHCSHHQ